jgi:hypothetical protein
MKNVITRMLAVSPWTNPMAAMIPEQGTRSGSRRWREAPAGDMLDFRLEI